MNKQSLAQRSDRLRPQSFLEPAADLAGEIAEFSQARMLRAALIGLGRGLLAVDDSTLDLPLRQLRVCLTLCGRKESMSELSRGLGVSLSAMTQVADRLERQGLVERVFDGSDRRVRFLQLTAKGEALMRSHEEAQLHKMAACLRRIGQQDSEKVLHALRVLVEACQSPSPHSAPESR
ncbi:MAG: MarR family transcriptional regulator [Pirellulales bacterium]